MTPHSRKHPRPGPQPSPTNYQANTEEFWNRLRREICSILTQYILHQKSMVLQVEKFLRQTAHITALDALSHALNDKSVRKFLVESFMLSQEEIAVTLNNANQAAEEKINGLARTLTSN